MKDYKIGDRVWIFIYGAPRLFTIVERLPNLDGKQFGLGFKLQFVGEHLEDEPELPDGNYYLQTSFYADTARDAINAEIKRTNNGIREIKKMLNNLRARAKELKTRRADLQRMLDRYPKEKQK